MRNALESIPSQHRTPDHFGLAYDVWSPKADFTGEEGIRDRDAWLAELERVAISEDYANAFAAWKSGFSAASSVVWTATLNSRLLIGHGNPSPTEVGLTVHHTWGVPMIPGTALKGVLSNYVQTCYGPEFQREMAPLDPAHSELDRARYQGAVWQNRRILHGPGEVFRNLFGAPSAESDEEFGVTARQGSVVFHDALLVPPAAHERQVFKRDILTVHQPTYYKGLGRPNDYDDPVPVAFMTVKPQVHFLIALSGPDGWVDLAADLLREALAEWGVGGKTAANYGRLTADPASISKWQSERTKMATASRNAALAAASPEERWNQLVAERKDGVLIDWARLVFEKEEDPLALVPVDRRPSDVDSKVEKRAFRDALESAGYLTAWHSRKTLHESTNLGPDRLRARAKAVRDFK